MRLHAAQVVTRVADSVAVLLNVDRSRVACAEGRGRGRARSYCSARRPVRPLLQLMCKMVCGE